MNIRAFFLLAAIGAAAIAGCGHTNKLAKHNIGGKTAIYRTYTTASAGSYAYVESPTKNNTVVDILAAIGSGVVSDQGRKKLQNAVNGDSIAQAVGRGISEATVDYLRLQPVATVADNPEFIVETELTQYNIVSGAYGVAIYVRGKSRVIERKTGIIVWEDSESHTIPLSETWVAGLAPTVVRSGASIFNAVQLLSLSEAEIRNVVNNGAVVAGREIGETLRDDVAEMHEK